MRALTKKYLKIYVHFWKVAFKLTALYRSDTIMLMVGVALALGLNALYFNAIFESTKSLGGWNIYEVFFLLGVFQSNWGFFKMLYGKAMETTMDKIFDGGYDFLLLKPINERFIAFTLPPMFKSIPAQIVGFVFIIYSLPNISLVISPTTLGIFALYTLISQLIVFSVFQAVITVAFSSGKSDELYAIIEHAWQYARYPGDLFSGKVFVILTFIIPITLFASYPTALLLGKVELTAYNIIYPLVVGFGIFWLSNQYYKYGIKKYSSASS